MLAGITKGKKQCCHKYLLANSDDLSAMYRYTIWVSAQLHKEFSTIIHKKLRI